MDANAGASRTRDDVSLRSVHAAQRLVASSAPASVPAKGPASLAAVVAGYGGCSASVGMQVSSGIAVPWTRAAGLVDEPSLQLE